MRKIDFSIYDNKLNKLFSQYNILKIDQVNIKNILNYEWDFFDKVKGMEGRAQCQDNVLSFIIMRLAQHLLFSAETRESILYDYKKYSKNGINPIAGKYARMMAYTDREEYDNFLKSLPPVSPIKRQIILDIIEIFQNEIPKIEEYLPMTLKYSRPLENKGVKISSLSYFYAELTYYSYGTLRRMKQDIKNMESQSCIKTIYKNTLTIHKTFTEEASHAKF